MPYNLRNRFVIATSTRALFDLSRENEIFEKQGLEAYEDWQIKHEDTPWSPGVAFPLIRTMLALNDYLPENRGVEVIVVSRNSPAIALRFGSSLKKYGLPISRYVFTSGECVAKYLDELQVNLFLSANVVDVKNAHQSGV
ncbi:MAG: 5'-nucleotidase, partial [Phycisphaerales bacterium]